MISKLIVRQRKILAAVLCVALFSLFLYKPEINSKKLTGTWSQRPERLDVTGLRPYFAITFYSEDSMSVGIVKMGKIYKLHSGKYRFTRQTNSITATLSDTAALDDFKVIKLTDDRLELYDKKENKYLKYSKRSHPYQQGIEADFYKGKDTVQVVVIKPGD